MFSILGPRVCTCLEPDKLKYFSREMFSLARVTIRSPCCGRPSPMIAFAFPSRLRLRTFHKVLHVTSPCCSSSPKPSLPLSTYLSTRRYQNLAPEPTKAPPSTQPPPPPSGRTLKDDSENPTPAEQRRKDWRIIWRLMENVWPKNDWNTRGRVLFGLGLLVGGKVRSWLQALGAGKAEQYLH